MTTNVGGQATQQIEPYTDHGRAFHNSYFEMLGEQGYPGLALWLFLQGACLLRMAKLRRRYKNASAEDAWVRPLATALQAGHAVYLLGAMFVGIAFQPFIYMMIALQISLQTYLDRREREARWRPLTQQVAPTDQIVELEGQAAPAAGPSPRSPTAWGSGG